MVPLRIVVTGEHQDWESKLPCELGHNGRPLEWISVPVLRFERLPIDPESMRDFCENPPDWIIFTSPRAVHFWCEALLESGNDFPEHTRIACVGEKTASSANLDGLNADFVPEIPGSESFLENFETVARADGSTPRVFLPQAEGGRTLIRDTLRAWGIDVKTVPLYRSVPREDVKEQITQEEVERSALVLFTSPSSVDAFIRHFTVPSHVNIGSIGRFTAEYLEKRGYRVRVLPDGDFERVGEIL